MQTKWSYKEAWPLKADDFMPYADFPHAYWSGREHTPWSCASLLMPVLQWARYVLTEWGYGWG